MWIFIITFVTVETIKDEQKHRKAGKDKKVVHHILSELCTNVTKCVHREEIWTKTRISLKQTNY